MKELLRVSKFTLKTFFYKLKIQPKGLPGEKWWLIIFCDADWAGDPEKRRSISGYILYFCGVPVLWKSRA